MNLSRIVLALPLALLVHSLAFADEPAPPRERRPPPPRYENRCDERCEGEDEPAPRRYNPRREYVCDERCEAPALPYPGPPLILVVPVQPRFYVPGPQIFVGPPVIAGPPVIYGRPPGFFGPPRFFPRDPRFRPYGFRPGAAHDCEVRQNNNGEFELQSSEGVTLYLDSSDHALDNVNYMKSFYAKQLNGLCGHVSQGTDSKEVGI